MTAGGDVSGRVVILSSDSEDDVAMRAQLAKHVKRWARSNGVDVWHEGLLPAGERLAQLEERLAGADVIVVLLTSDLLAEDRRFALAEAWLNRDVEVVPVRARACLLKGTVFADRALLPANGLTIAMLGDAVADGAWMEIGEHLSERWETLRSRSGRAAAGLQPPHPAQDAVMDRDASTAHTPPASTRSGVPMPPNNLPRRRLFVGREKDLAAVHERLARSGTASITQRTATVFGLGGVGKTSLALEYAHLHLHEYPGGVYWVRAEGEPVSALVAFSGELTHFAPREVAAGLNNATSNAEEIARHVQFALQKAPGRALLVLDNVDDDWRAHLPGGHVQVLVTTRDPQRALGDDAARVGLDMLERDDALALADKITDGCAEEDLAARDRVVLKELGALAVAVEMAARAVRKWTKTWTRYETELKTHDAALLEDPKLYGEAYDRGAFGAIDLSLERCTDPAARALLNSLATMAPESAPMDWAEAGAGLTTGTLEADRAWEAIADGGFVRLTVTERAERQVSLHRLVHRRLAATMPARDRAGCAARMAPTVETWLDETVDASRLQVVELRVPHGIAILDALAVDEKGLLWIRIADHLAHHFWHQGSYETARRWLERALEAAERLSAPEELRVAPQLSNLALVLKDLGDPNGARPLLERALRIHEASLGPDHPNVAIHLSNLALVLQDLGDANGARPLLERALRTDEASRGPDHPYVAIDLSCLAMVLKDLGDANGARPLLERAVAMAEKRLGPAHPNTRLFRKNLASLEPPKTER